MNWHRVRQRENGRDMERFTTHRTRHQLVVIALIFLGGPVRAAFSAWAQDVGRAAANVRAFAELCLLHCSPYNELSLPSLVHRVVAYVAKRHTCPLSFSICCITNSAPEPDVLLCAIRMGVTQMILPKPRYVG